MSIKKKKLEKTKPKNNPSTSPYLSNRPFLCFEFMTGNTTYLEESRSSLEQRACVADRWRKLAAHETGHEIQTLPQVIYKNKSQVARVKQVEGTSTPVSVSDSPITLSTLQ